MQLFAEKSERLKQAKKEAEKEIAAYRQQREEAYKKQISDVRQSRRGLMCLAMPKGASAGFEQQSGPYCMKHAAGLADVRGYGSFSTCDKADSFSWLPGLGG